jgi:hypothetical protein
MKKYAYVVVIRARQTDRQTNRKTIKSCSAYAWRVWVGGWGWGWRVSKH